MKPNKTTDEKFAVLLHIKCPKLTYYSFQIIKTEFNLSSLLFDRVLFTQLEMWVEVFMFVIGSMSTRNAISWSSLKLLTVINPTVPGTESRDIFEHETTYNLYFNWRYVERDTQTQSHKCQIIDSENSMPIAADNSQPNPYNFYFKENKNYRTHTFNCI
jgi:hypothetical protein